MRYRTIIHGTAIALSIWAGGIGRAQSDARTSETVAGQQVNSQAPQQSGNVEELLKHLSPKERDELLKRLQGSAPQAQSSPAAETVAPPPQATAEPKTPSPAPKAKASAGCEESKAVGTAARVGGLWWYRARVAIAKKTGVDAVGMATEAAQTPCKPTAPAKDKASK